MKNFVKKLNFDWVKAAAVRAVKTMAQTALSMLTVGQLVTDINWRNVVSVAVVAGVYSVLNSVATKLPELPVDGTMNVDVTDPDEHAYKLDVDTPLVDLPNKKTMVVKINTTSREKLTL